MRSIEHNISSCNNMSNFMKEKYKKEEILINNILSNKKRLYEKKRQAEKSIGFCAEEAMYRFYHQSYKAYHIQEWTKDVINIFKELLNCEFNSYFEEITNQGTNLEFELNHNINWSSIVRPILEAYFHTKHLLDMMIKYVIEGSQKLRQGNPGWFTVLYLYKIR